MVLTPLKLAIKSPKLNLFLQPEVIQSSLLKLFIVIIDWHFNYFWPFLRTPLQKISTITIRSPFETCEMLQVEDKRPSFTLNVKYKLCRGKRWSSTVNTKLWPPCRLSTSRNVLQRVPSRAPVNDHTSHASISNTLTALSCPSTFWTMTVTFGWDSSETHVDPRESYPKLLQKDSQNAMICIKSVFFFCLFCFCNKYLLHIVFCLTFV